MLGPSTCDVERCGASIWVSVLAMLTVCCTSIAPVQGDVQIAGTLKEALVAEGTARVKAGDVLCLL